MGPITRIYASKSVKILEILSEIIYLSFQFFVNHETGKVSIKIYPLIMARLVELFHNR